MGLDSSTVFKQVQNVNQKWVKLHMVQTMLSTIQESVTHNHINITISHKIYQLNSLG